MFAGLVSLAVWALWFLIQSGRPGRDAAAGLVFVTALAASLWAARWLESNLPFAAGPGSESLRLTTSGRKGWLLLLAAVLVSAVAIGVAWPALTLQADASPRFLIVATRHGDEGLYKQILLRMLESQSLDPHPEYIYFNYGHLHINLVMAPVLTLRSQLADPGAVALVGARFVNFGSLLALAGLGALWIGRRCGAWVGACFGAILLTQDNLLTRALVAQSPDVLCGLLCCVAAAKAAVFAEERRTRDLVVAVFLAGAGFGTKYVGLFLLPIFVPLLAWTWWRAARLDPEVKPTLRKALQAVALFGLVFCGAVFVCSPYHALEPQAMALVFFRAGSEYLPSDLAVSSPYRAAFDASLLDTLLVLSLLATVVIALIQGVRRWRQGEEPIQGLQVLAAWVLLWSGYAALFLRTNVGPHLLLPAFALYPLALVLGLSRLPNLPLRVVACLLLVASALVGPTLEWGGRPARVSYVLGHNQHDFLAPPHLEFQTWLEASGLPPETRISGDENPTYVPDRFPTYAHSFGTYFQRGVGLFLSLPEVLIVSKGWLELYPTIESAPNLRALEKRDFYAALAKGSAPPYEAAAETTENRIYVVPWAWSRELLTDQVKVEGALEQQPFRNANKVHFIGAEFLSYGESPAAPSAGSPLVTTFTLPEPAQARWLVLLWESRENFPGWYKDEAYAKSLRLEVESAPGVWTPLHSVDSHVPDAYGGLWTKLPAHAQASRYRLVLSDWHGPRPAALRRFSLLTARPPAAQRDEPR
jgi:hypothetical protein